MTNILLITSLISLLSNSLDKVSPFLLPHVAFAENPCPPEAIGVGAPAFSWHRQWWLKHLHGARAA